MRVLLVYPAPQKTHWPRGPFRSHWVPTGLAFLATALQRAGHEVRVLVRHEQLIKAAYDWSAAEAELRDVLKQFRPEMLGLSAVSSVMPETGRIAALAKQLVGENVLVVAGGPHPTALPEQTLAECPAIDVIALGEGEQTIVSLAQRGIQTDIAGIVYRADGEFLRTDTAEPIQALDDLGGPAWDLFDMNFYTQPNRWLIRWLKLSTVNIRTSRGCPSRCRFCAGHLVAGLGVRYHSVEYVLDLVARAVKDFGVEGIRFEDDTIGSDRQRLLAICDGLRRLGLHRKIRWDCCLRVDQAETELLQRMKQAGCVQVEYGFECGSDAALRRLAKNASVNLNRRAVELTRQVGLRIFADIMVALPGETKQEFQATVDFLRWARPEIISATRLCPLPGTPIFDALPPEVRRNIDWADYTYLDTGRMGINLTAMTSDHLEKLCRNFHRYIIRPQNIRAMLRDTPREDRSSRRRYVGMLMRFFCHHPLRAVRVPW